MRFAVILRDLRAGPPSLPPVRQPFTISLGGWLSAFTGLLWPADVPLAALDIGTYSINDHSVSGPYFFTHVDVFVAPIALLLVAIAAGIRMGRPWVRPLILIFWGSVISVYVGVCLVAPGEVGESVAALIELLLIAAMAYWYLYIKRNVAAYFVALEAHRRRLAHPASGPTSTSALGV